MSSAIDDPGDAGTSDVPEIAAGLVPPTGPPVVTPTSSLAAGDPAVPSIPRSTDRWAGPLATEEDFEQFFVEEWAKVVAFIRCRVPWWPDATIQDAAQEAWSAVFNKLGRIREARAYLYTTVESKIADELRLRVDAVPDEDLEARLAAVGAAGDDPVDVVVARERAVREVNPAAREVLGELFALPERRRVAYSLRVGYGMSSVEIAKVLGCTPGAVDGLVHQARLSLRLRLGPDRVDWFEAGEWRWPE
jgi:RNA polymerase sigma factor (sigma-70 family)